ncbi:MAG: hypothetical protein IJ689_00200 [Alphaproteobacteria bacterium]|nr:hypothetical protein [Alphaproteobacteria bacterium]
MITLKEKKESLQKKLRFAARIMRLLPDVKRPRLKQFWPDMKHDDSEKADWESSSPRLRPNPQEISLMEKILEWYRPLDAFETKLVWQRALGKPWKILCHELARSRSSLAACYSEAISKMLIFVEFNRLQTA